ncbi:MAG: 4-hydroxy-tetrahydrodipicolinate synthase [Candidatus Diapherotrites archaeon]|nr:4-hydroxy-tetrahydrodipicolinate synthase [Candidatus Diapherotrites archaeon]
MAKKLKGCFPALITPMKEDGDRLNHAINWDCLKELIAYVTENGVTGVVPAGCTGHAAAMTVDEQVRLIKFARENTPEKFMVLAGDGSNCTREAIEFAKKVEREIGPCIHMQISPYQNKPTMEGMFQHYGKIAEAIQGELVVYNVPGRTGKNIEPDTTVRLAKEYSNIIAIKEASGNIEQIKKIIAETSDMPFSVISGDDPLTLEVIRAGGTGCISVAANIAPGQTAEYIRLALEGKFEEAEAIEKTLHGLFKAIFIETNPCPTHYALRKMGYGAGIPRLPLVDITAKSKAEMDRVLAELGIAK